MPSQPGRRRRRGSSGSRSGSRRRATGRATGRATARQSGRSKPWPSASATRLVSARRWGSAWRSAWRSARRSAWRSAWRVGEAVSVAVVTDVSDDSVTGTAGRAANAMPAEMASAMIAIPKLWICPSAFVPSAAGIAGKNEFHGAAVRPYLRHPAGVTRSPGRTSHDGRGIIGPEPNRFQLAPWRAGSPCRRSPS